MYLIFRICSICVILLLSNAASTRAFLIPARPVGFPLNAPMRIGTVVAWGSNVNGQTNVPPDLSSVVAVAAGSSHSVALKSDGTVVAWGHNNSGEPNVPDALRGVVAIAAGSAHTLGLRSDGMVAAWGTGAAAVVPAGLSNVVAVAAGTSY